MRAHRPDGLTNLTTRLYHAAMPLRRLKGYKAAANVARFRPEAERMRKEDPDTYEQILAQSRGGPSESAAQRDPDAYVALFIAEVRKRGYLS